MLPLNNLLIKCGFELVNPKRTKSNSIWYNTKTKVKVRRIQNNKDKQIIFNMQYETKIFELPKDELVIKNFIKDNL